MCACVENPFSPERVYAYTVCLCVSYSVCVCVGWTDPAIVPLEYSRSQIKINFRKYWDRKQQVVSELAWHTPHKSKILTQHIMPKKKRTTSSESTRKKRRKRIKQPIYLSSHLYVDFEGNTGYLVMAPRTHRREKKKKANNNLQAKKCVLAVRKHDFASSLFPELIRTLHKIMKVQMPFFVSREACIMYGWHNVSRTRFQDRMSWMVSLLALIFFTLLHDGLDIKLRDSTGQVKVHKVKRKKHIKWKKKRAGNEHPVVVDVDSPVSSSLPTHRPKLWCWCCPPLLVEPGGFDLSHRERNEAVVSLDVPLEDLWARPQHALEAGPVQLHTLERAAGDYSGGPGAVQQQGDFTWTRKMRGHTGLTPTYDRKIHCLL